MFNKCLLLLLLFFLKYLTDVSFVFNHDWKLLLLADWMVMKPISFIIMQIRVSPSFSVCVAFKEIYCQFIIFKILIFYHEDIRTKVTICFFHFLPSYFALPSTFLLIMQ